MPPLTGSRYQKSLLVSFLVPINPICPFIKTLLHFRFETALWRTATALQRNRSDLYYSAQRKTGPPSFRVFSVEELHGLRHIAFPAQDDEIVDVIHYCPNMGPTLCCLSPLLIGNGAKMISIKRTGQAVVHFSVIALLCLAASGSGAQTTAVPVNAEPLHRIKLDTPKYRVYDVVVDQNSAMLFHEHQADLFAVLLSESDITNEIQGGQKQEVSVKAGIVTFAPASPAKSYVHRVLLRGGEPFHTIAIELLQPWAPPTLAPNDNPEVPDVALTLVKDSPRGKAYRLNLAPDQTVVLPSRVSDIFLMCLSNGSVEQSGGGQPGITRTCQPGSFHLLEKPREVTLKNKMNKTVEMIIISLH